MKISIENFAVIVLVGAILQTAHAETEVPFVFQSGQPARAAEVNRNFSTVVTGVNANESAIATNSVSITANAVEISNVSTLVAANSTAISANATDILANTTAIAANSSEISSNSQTIAGLTTTVDGHTQDISAIGDAVASLTPAPPYVFIGYSTAQVDGTVGYFGMHGACQADFGPAARMASSYEIISSATVPIVRPNVAWVRPTTISVILQGSNVRYDDFSGAQAFNSLSCEGYTGSASGLVVDQKGSFLPVGCVSALPVACSVPQ